MIEAPAIEELTDEALVARSRNRDPQAREELFRRHRDEAFRVARRLLGDDHDALDAVQDALLKAFSRLESYDGRGGFRFWLLRIVTNTALDWGRRRKRRVVLTLDGEPASASTDDDPARGLDREDLRRALDEALEGLSPRIRATFVLFAESGLSYKEIAETQGVPIGTVMSRINAARGKLQAALDWEKLGGLG